MTRMIPSNTCFVWIENGRFFAPNRKPVGVRGSVGRCGKRAV
jgi:hypothetical protein